MSSTRTRFKTCDNDLLINLEREIIKGKIAQGINGIEWLVMFIKADESMISKYAAFMKKIKNKKMNLDCVIIDCFLLDSDDFREKYQISWWMSVSGSIYYLQWLKERNYDQYFNLLQKYELDRKENIYGFCGN